jgi:hypothetical protein
MFVLFLGGTVFAQEAVDAVFLDFWQREQAADGDHDLALNLCTKYLDANPASPYRLVVQGIVAWQEMARGRTAEAGIVLTNMLDRGQGAVALAANEMALRWLTRLDRERIRRALLEYYARSAVYPQSLAELGTLPVEWAPPMTDRRGDAWNYRPAGFKRLPGLVGQRYVLESRQLGERSDLAEALRVPYGSRILWRPIRLVAAAEDRCVVEFDTGGDRPLRVAVAEGGEREGTVFVKRMGSILLMSDRDHWAVRQLPEAGDPKP